MRSVQHGIVETARTIGLHKICAFREKRVFLDGSRSQPDLEGHICIRHFERLSGT